ncbi:MAG: polymer-forming cytoskeletal protein [Myxococcales bacterium]|nr:polymer-forming cytoskeletal protein [Myxococcales bacterium]MCB9647663.1 polymer-forming cytoskeletal protein [Deltaproteobacteria bacterium]
MAMLGGKRDEPANVTRLKAQEFHTVLAREARFSGKLTFEGVVRIDGKFDGEVFTDDLLVIGSGAEVKANLNVGSAEISGTVEGEIRASTSVELKAPARVKGTIITPALVVERGVTFDGHCQMSTVAGSEKASARPASVPPPVPDKSGT